MPRIHHTLKAGGARVAVLSLLSIALFAALTVLNSVNVSAQGRTVYVEGNCSAGQTVAAPVGSCGDYDGDGRLGTAEDIDPADQVFGTLNGALGPGMGAAAGTGINQDGKIVIVTSGRFSETAPAGSTAMIYIGQNTTGGSSPGVSSPGSVTIEAAPGVEATLDAVNPTDPAGTTTRLGGAGIQVVYQTALDRVVTLRNLEIRNFLTGVVSNLNSNVQIDNCRFENNFNFGILAADNSRVSITRTQVVSTGRRGTAAPTIGQGIAADNTARASISFTTVSHSAGFGIANRNSPTSQVAVFKVESVFNVNGPTTGTVTVTPDHNFFPFN